MDRRVESGAVNSTAPATTTPAKTAWVRSDGAGFFPDEIGKLIGKLNGFSVSRWNFVVIDPVAGSDRDDLPLRLCASLKSEFKTGYQFQCQLTAGVPGQIVTEWARDLPLRRTMPETSAVLDEMNVTLAKAGLLADPELRGLLRHDPFGSYQELLSRLETQKPVKLSVRNDFLVEPDSGRVLIPMLVGHDPLDVASTEKLASSIAATCKGKDGQEDACSRVGFLGGHFASLENQRQVVDDLSIVSVSGVISLILSLILLKIFKQMRLLFVLIPVAAAMLMAAAVIVLKDGWIHGLTLSFGSGLVGLSVDYGAHAAFHGREPGIWRSNLMGLLTTLVVLGVLAFTEIPVLRQLMFFAMLGLTFSYLVMFAMHHFFPKLVAAEPLKLPALKSRVMGIVMGLFVVAGCVGLIGGKYALDLQSLNYMGDRTKSLYVWFQQAAKMNNLFVIHDDVPQGSLLTDLHAEKQWAESAGVRLENAALYVPLLATQEQNRSTWFDADCDYKFKAALDETQRRFFAPYWSERPCAAVTARSLEPGPDAGAPPAYVAHLASKDGWISIFFPENAEQTAATKARFPSAFSLVEVAQKFPTLFKSELSWMIPLTLVAIALVLAFYFRSLYLSIAAILPFLSGVGAVVVVSTLTGEPLNFVAMIALLMLCGLSVDFGIFTVDQCRGTAEHPEKTQSALLFCCISSLLGVVPMIFAGHPVLRSLGMPLAVGQTGALLGSIFGVPAFMSLRRRRPARA